MDIVVLAKGSKTRQHIENEQIDMELVVDKKEKV